MKYYGFSLSKQGEYKKTDQKGASVFELIIFDCDGVLIDSEWIANEIEVEELAQLGCKIWIEDYLDMALGRTNPEVEKRLLELYKISLPEGYWDRVIQRQKKVFDEKLQPISGVREVLENLTIPVCVASSSNAVRLEHTLSITGIWPFFNGKIFGAECVTKGKPSPDIFLYAAKQMNTKPSKCLVIEDSIHGVEAAHAAGMLVWGFHGGKHFGTSSRVDILAKAGVSELFDDMGDLLSLIERKANGTAIPPSPRLKDL